MSSTTTQSSAAGPAKRKPVPRYSPRAGWTVLSAGFRPFFLLGAIFAAVAVLLWLPVYHGELTLQTAFAPRDWHVHEMLYGYLPAVITGFLLTAIPNWTGRLPLQGAPLATLALVWLAGRLAVTFSADTGWLAALLIDASFLVLVALAALREIIAGRNWRNLNVVALLTLLLAGNVAFHLEAHVGGAADYSIRIGIAVVILLISLIGGRVTPSFTRNWLVREQPGRLPQPFNKVDMAIVAFSALTLVLWVVLPVSRISGAALLLAGVLHLVRLARWAGDRTVKEKLLLVLHVGYFFVPLGFLLTSAAAFELIPASAGIHAWMVGGAGVMTLAVMTRASLGHTGQPLTASLSTQGIYLAALFAVAARIAASLLPDWSDPLLHLAALGWATAFLGFALGYGPTLLARGKPH
ncbi:NnrS family protein [Rhodopseudomonas sp. BR0M22]|uniref:NnrS family protein n=1 Tax=Rhodopseudomonas sp. BR0M22 TaxID=2269369 RepID=UPI0013DEF05D|nr:NnrS family protein [Rhodopseudomonas sp. BR0M22]NEW93210.1 NnrS family protein [Rhodopseudomonas sp. BR0M22]